MQLMDNVSDFHESPCSQWSENLLIDIVLTSATAVHRELGPGLLESVYQAALMIELAERGVAAKAEVPVNARYRGIDLGLGFRADIIVDDRLLLELKGVEKIVDAHIAQVISYLKLLGLRRGYILNFGAALMKDGIKRVSV
jgi:GxxExxY protein